MVFVALLTKSFYLPVLLAGNCALILTKLFFTLFLVKLNNFVETNTVYLYTLWNRNKVLVPVIREPATQLNGIEVLGIDFYLYWLFRMDTDGIQVLVS